jgi:hypothetical protein
MSFLFKLWPKIRLLAQVFKLQGLYIKFINVATFQTYYELAISNLNSEYSFVYVTRSLINYIVTKLSEFYHYYTQQNQLTINHRGILGTGLNLNFVQICIHIVRNSEWHPYVARDKERETK